MARVKVQVSKDMKPHKYTVSFTESENNLLTHLSERLSVRVPAICRAIVLDTLSEKKDRLANVHAMLERRDENLEALYSQGFGTPTPGYRTSGSDQNVTVVKNVPKPWE
ncbi:hypothetical protein GCM10011360_02690 [Primorskyibacter flagellatus]|uniref:Uncharacterized protein n=1 Tax=Primorskyibacter flagellatus TaxID=1387277 RepID=A0A917E9I8_9RHOB|nr:hypothetical protein [Primorskyibacter flagellatus]GGE17336.1 hypothetical protein GCM10011360_02690 [Primorskyibacter flagellatus]